MDAATADDARDSTIALRESCSGELKLNTVKILINFRAFIRIITFLGDGRGQLIRSYYIWEDIHVYLTKIPMIPVALLCIIQNRQNAD